MMTSVTGTFTAEERAALFESGVDQIFDQDQGLIYESDGDALELTAPGAFGPFSSSDRAGFAALSNGNHVGARESGGSVLQILFGADGAPLQSSATAMTVGGNSYGTINGDAGVIALPGGGYVVLGAGAGLQQRVYGPDGAPLAAQADTIAPETAAYPSGAALSDGGYAVTWVSSTSATPGDPSTPRKYDVYVARFEADGTAIGAPVRVTPQSFQVFDEDFLAGELTSPRVTELADGFVVTWSNQSKIFAQRYDDADAAVGQVAELAAAGGNNDASVVPLQDGGFMLVWSGAPGYFYDYDSPLRFTFEIFQQRFDASGSAVGERLLLDKATAGYIPKLVDTVSLPDGGYVVSYVGYGPDYVPGPFPLPTTTTFLRFFDAEGDPIGGPIDTAGVDVERAADGSLIIRQGALRQLLQDADYHVLTSAPDEVIGTADGAMIVTTPGDLGAADSLQGGAGSADVLELSAPGPIDLASLAVFSGIEQVLGASGDDVFVASEAMAAAGLKIDGRGGVDAILSTGSYALKETDAVERLGAADASSTVAATLTGNSAANDIFASAGADSLSGLGGADTLSGSGGSDTLDGGLGADLLGGDKGSDSLAGGGDADTLAGSGGSDTLDGGLGADSMAGGDGDDTYLIDSDLDRATEGSGGGDDLVLTSLSGFSLAEEFERLHATDATSTAALTFIGNGGANEIRGNDGENNLHGGGGTDTLVGGGGDDVLFVDDRDAVVVELQDGGADRVVSTVSYVLSDFVETLQLIGDGALEAVGNGAANRLRGAEGANRLDGRGGADTMLGGAGDDVYIVDAKDDTVSEKSGEGLDTVLASASFRLAGEVETIRLTGETDIDATGNDKANEIRGNAGDNRLDGGKGADAMAGGKGDDVYVVDRAKDLVVEKSGGGTDTVLSSVSFELTGQIEALRLTGTLNLDATGNGRANEIRGNSADNALDGGLGRDTLIGGKGDDVFAFTTAPGASNADVIDDFKIKIDVIELDGRAFKGLAEGRLAKDAFHLGTQAADAEDRILYDAGTGNLFFDRDGASDRFEAVRFARLEGAPAIAAGDFVVA